LTGSDLVKIMVKKMKGKKIILALILFFSGLSVLSDESKEWRKLERGAIIVKNQKDPQTRDRISLGRVLIPAPWEVVWGVLTDYQSYPQFYPKLKEIKLLKKEGSRVWLDMVFSNLFLFSDFKARMVYEQEPSQWFLSYQIEEGDFKKFYGSWKLSPVNQTHSLVELRLYQYVGWWWFPFIPSSAFNNSLVSELLHSLRKQVEKCQLENGSKPEEVIKPIWRKSRYKELEKKKAKPKKKE